MQKSFGVDLDHEFVVVVVIVIFDWESSVLEAEVSLDLDPAHPARRELGC